MSWDAFQKFLEGQVKSIEDVYCQQTQSWLAEVAALRSSPVESSDDVDIHSMDSWMKENTGLCTVLSDYRSQAMVIGNGAVKLGLFVSAVRYVDFESEEYLSLTRELQSQIQTLSNILSCSLQSKMSYELQSSFLRSHRAMMVHFHDLVHVISIGGPKSSVESAAGMVLHISEEVQKVPITHKAAMRRFVMEKCLVVKETIEEFGGYLLEAAEKAIVEDVVDGDGDCEKEGSDCSDEERDYSEEEVGVVDQCVLLMRQTQKLLKLLLNTATSLGDSVASMVEKPERDAAYRLLARCSLTAYVLEGAIIDLGAELYPPLQDTQVRKAFQGLLDSLHKALRLLRIPAIDCVLRPDEREEMGNIEGQLMPLS